MVTLIYNVNSYNVNNVLEHESAFLSKYYKYKVHIELIFVILKIKKKC